MADDVSLAFGGGGLVSQDGQAHGGEDAGVFDHSQRLPPALGVEEHGLIFLAPNAVRVP